MKTSKNVMGIVVAATLVLAALMSGCTWHQDPLVTSNAELSTTNDRAAVPPNMSESS